VSGTKGFSWRAFLPGAALHLAVVILPVTLAMVRLPWPLFILIVVAVVAVAVWTVSRHREVTRGTAVVFVLGAGMVQAALAVLFGVLGGNGLWAVAGTAFAMSFTIALVRIRRKSRAVATPYAGNHG
jgi:FtsH-binding integral membrane protein